MPQPQEVEDHLLLFIDLGHVQYKLMAGYGISLELNVTSFIYINLRLAY
jgi:hypothetical protein